MKIFIDFPKKYNQKSGFRAYLWYNHFNLYYDFSQGGFI